MPSSCWIWNHTSRKPLTSMANSVGFWKSKPWAASGKIRSRAFGMPVGDDLRVEAAGRCASLASLTDLDFGSALLPQQTQNVHESVRQLCATDHRNHWTSTDLNGLPRID